MAIVVDWDAKPKIQMVSTILQHIFHSIPFNSPSYEACIGYFQIRDIGSFLRDTGLVVFFYFGISDI